MLTQKQHPNLVAVREIPAALVTVLNSPEPCLGMELCEGGDLRKVQAVILISDRTCGKLEALHLQEENDLEYL